MPGWFSEVPTLLILLGGDDGLPAFQDLSTKVVALVVGNGHSLLPGLVAVKAVEAKGLAAAVRVADYLFSCWRGSSHW